jgi:hypothetical protein
MSMFRSRGLNTGGTYGCLRRWIAVIASRHSFVKRSSLNKELTSS